MQVLLFLEKEFQQDVISDANSFPFTLYGTSITTWLSLKWKVYEADDLNIKLEDKMTIISGSVITRMIEHI